MTTTVTTKEYIPQGISIPEVLGSIIDDYTPDFECTFRDGRKECFKNKDLQDFDFEGVTSIIVYTELVISKKVNFKYLESISGEGKIILVDMFERAEEF